MICNAITNDHGELGGKEDPITNSDNPRNGAEFERIARELFAGRGLTLSPDYPLAVGAGRSQAPHSFDLGSDDPPVIVECKAHRWTTGGNAPSAKLSVWNEAMHYFQCAPSGYRKVLFVLRDLRGDESLAEYYVRRYGHLVPLDVDIWEYNPTTGAAVALDLA